MSANARRILVSTDVVERVWVRIGRGLSQRSFCKTCGATGESIDLNAAVTATGLSAKVLLARIDSGVVHSPDISTGHLVICVESLKQQPDLGDVSYEIE